MNYPRPDRRWTPQDIESVARKRLQRHEQARVEIAHDLAVNGTSVPDYHARGKRPVIADRLYPLVLLCHAHGLPEPRPEYEFHPTRGWRFDYCWIAQKIAVEIDGGVFTGGRHVRGNGFIEDQRKLNAATLLGYRVLRYTPDRLGEAIGDLKILLETP